MPHARGPATATSAPCCRTTALLCVTCCPAGSCTTPGEKVFARMQPRHGRRIGGLRVGGAKIGGGLRLRAAVRGVGLNAGFFLFSFRPSGHQVRSSGALPHIYCFALLAQLFFHSHLHLAALRLHHAFLPGKQSPPPPLNGFGDEDNSCSAAAVGKGAAELPTLHSRGHFS